MPTSYQNRITSLIPVLDIYRYPPKIARKLHLISLANLLSDAVIHIVLSHPRLPVPSERIRKNRHLSASVKKEALHDCVILLQSLGLSPFLAYGTLLGVVRDGDFIASDLDLDLGLFWTESVSIPTIMHALKTHQFTLEKCPVKGKNDRFKLRHLNGISIDIVLFSDAPNGQIENYVQVLTHSFPRYRSRFSLKKIDFQGLSVCIPDPPELFLTEHYGDWKTPTAYYHPFMSPKIQTSITHPVLQLGIKESLIDCLYKGDRTRLKDCLTLILSKDPSQYWQRIAKKLGPHL